MLIIDVKGDKYGIVFLYDEPESNRVRLMAKRLLKTIEDQLEHLGETLEALEPLLSAARLPPRKHRMTVAKVFAPGKTREDDVLICAGEANCSRLDTFNRAKGRKLALSRALAKTSWTKEYHLAFWESLFAVKGFHRE